MSIVEKALNDSVFRRAYEDTSRWSGKLYFLIADVVITGLVAIFSDNNLLAIIVFLGILLSGYLFFLGQAPIRQRNELRNTAIEKQSQIDELNTSFLTCRFGFISFSAIPPKNQILVISNVTIRNSSSPSNAGKFKLSVFIDNVEYVTSLYLPSEDLRITDTLKIHKDDLLLKSRTGFSPKETELIPEGDSIDGWVLGLFKTKTVYSLFERIRDGENHEVTYSLYFEDVKDRSTRAEKSFNEFIEIPKANNR